MQLVDWLVGLTDSQLDVTTVTPVLRDCSRDLKMWPLNSHNTVWGQFDP